MYTVYTLYVSHMPVVYYVCIPLLPAPCLFFKFIWLCWVLVVACGI